jgi:hypothetical protein
MKQAMPISIVAHRDPCPARTLRRSTTLYRFALAGAQIRRASGARDVPAAGQALVLSRKELCKGCHRRNPERFGVLSPWHDFRMGLPRSAIDRHLARETVTSTVKSTYSTSFTRSSAHMDNPDAHPDWGSV